MATEETVLLVFSRNDFMKILAETPEVLIEMRNNLTKRSVMEQMSEEQVTEKQV